MLKKYPAQTSKIDNCTITFDVVSRATVIEGGGKSNDAVLESYLISVSQRDVLHSLLQNGKLRSSGAITISLVPVDGKKLKNEIKKHYISAAELQ